MMIRNHDPGRYLSAARATDEAVGERAVDVEHWTPESLDPVAIYDAMREAGTSLIGSYVWLADHTSDPDDERRWMDAARAVHAARDRIAADDVESQRRATADYIARELDLRPLITL